MNPELTYTLELARVFKSCVGKASALQERTGADLAFDRSLKRGNEAIIAMLYAACEELAPSDGAEVAKFIRSLEYGEVPAPAPTEIRSQKSEVRNSKRARSRMSRGAAVHAVSEDHRQDACATATADEKSREVMAQWR